MRRLLCALLGLFALLTVSPRVMAAPPDTVPPEDTSAPTTVAPGEAPTTTSGLPPAMGPLVVVPTGCVVPPPAHAVFHGTTLLVDDPETPSTYRFRIDSLLAGSLDGFAVGQLVDVGYGDEARFLEVGSEYLVGVAVSAETGLLVSKVRAPAPLFGGDAVIGADDSDIDCPRVDDPVRTLRVDGTSVDTGVFTPLRGERSSLLRALWVPLAIAFGTLLSLVLMKHLLFAVGRSLRDLADSTARVPRRRARRHRAPSAGDQALQ
jgi:hypothetical protein